MQPSQAPLRPSEWEFIVLGVLSPELSIEIAVWVAIGGRGSLVGAIFGAVVVSGLKFVLTGLVPELWPFILAILVVGIVIYLPNGFLIRAKVFSSNARGWSPLRIRNIVMTQFDQAIYMSGLKRLIRGIFSIKKFKLASQFWGGQGECNWAEWGGEDNTTRRPYR